MTFLDLDSVTTKVHGMVTEYVLLVDVPTYAIFQERGWQINLRLAHTILRFC